MEPRGSLLPIENSPPGIHTMPSGATAGGRVGLGTVGRNAEAVEVGCGSAESCEAGGLVRVRRKASTTKRATATAATAHFHCPPWLRCFRRECVVVADRFMTLLPSKPESHSEDRTTGDDVIPEQFAAAACFVVHPQHPVAKRQRSPLAHSSLNDREQMPGEI